MKLNEEAVQCDVPAWKLEDTWVLSVATSQRLSNLWSFISGAKLEILLFNCLVLLTNL